MGSKKRYFSRFLAGVLTAAFLMGLSGCQIVEPEKRAYPLVVGIDWQQGQYQICLGMARLAVSTGQGKEGGDGQEGNNSGALVLTGESREEIMKIYNSTQELYLDPGHVQAVIFGSGILAEDERMRGVLEEMEGETGLGNGAYVFKSDDVRDVLGTNGNQVESLGKYLSGIYENRTDEGNPVTLAQVYLGIHNGEGMPEIPEIWVLGEEIMIEKGE